MLEDWIVGTPDGTAKLPPEVVIREFLKADLSDQDQLVAFAAEFGMPGFPVPSAGVTLSPFGEFGGPLWGAPIVRSRSRLEGLQSDVQHWISHKKGENVLKAYDDLAYVESALPAGPFDTPTDAAWWYWAHGLDSMIEDYRPGISVASDDGEFHTGQIAWSGLPTVEMGLALQLVQLAYDRDLPLRNCPVCGGWWVRHRGRAQKGQYRTKGGVKYCSARCASTQATRDARQRKVEEAQ